MLELLIQIILVLYASISIVLFVYSCVEFSLLISFLFRKKSHQLKEWEELPRVTIQLPLYNETYVVERLIDTVVKMDYPKELLDIQVLDDSTDDTEEKAQKKVAFYQEKGIDIQYIRREDRYGFKAGALDYGMEFSKGDFIAIFDADFLPEQDFLQKVMGYFNDENVGVVQTRWGYTNKNYSLLTRLQTIILNTHFTVEQEGRNSSGAYINFNGTAGVWRKYCIYDSGGWMADTLTEDLDLSFRAQVRGWKFNYVRSIESPSELPVTLAGFKSQQFRWTKGAAECARKNLPMLWRVKGQKFWAKWIGSFHLLNSSVYLVVLGFVLLSFPLTYALQHISETSWLWSLIPLFLTSNLLLLCVFLGGNAVYGAKKWWEWLLFPFLFLSFLTVNLGISLYMSLGVIEGYIGKKSAFIRTPKFNVDRKKKLEKQHKYEKTKLAPIVFVEALIALYGGFQIAYAASVGDIFAMCFAIMFTTGFTYNVIASIYYTRTGGN